MKQIIIYDTMEPSNIFHIFQTFVENNDLYRQKKIFYVVQSTIYVAIEHNTVENPNPKISTCKLLISDKGENIMELYSSHDEICKLQNNGFLPLEYNYRNKVFYCMRGIGIDDIYLMQGIQHVVCKMDVIMKSPETGGFLMSWNKVKQENRENKENTKKSILHELENFGFYEFPKLIIPYLEYDIKNANPFDMYE